MSSFQLQENVHIMVTPGGAYYAATTPEPTPAKGFLLKLMSLPQTPKADSASIAALAGALDEEDFRELIYRVQRAGWIRGEDSPRTVPAINMETDMPQLLQAFSSERRAVLADFQGFLLAASGFAHEAAEEVALLAADVAAVARRYRAAVSGNLGISSASFALVDAAGCSELGFWPLFFGRNDFVVALAGEPIFNQPAFVDFVWGLAYRYAKGAAAAQVS